MYYIAYYILLFKPVVRQPHRSACVWFLEIDLVHKVCVCVCVSAPDASNN